MRSIYAEPRLISDLSDCCFYHTMDIPNWGLVKGQWDLRRGVEDYLGHVEFGGKRVLEIGAADGFFSFHMESSGARVVSYDLSDDYEWDVVPCALVDGRRGPEHKRGMRMLNNAYWLAHRAFGSKAQVVHGTVYDVPEEIGAVDITTFGSVLLHVRDPFLALQKALRLTRQTVIVTELFRDPRTKLYNLSPARYFARAVERMRRKLVGPSMLFLPDERAGEAHGIWWYLPPEIIQRFLGVLGFEETRVTYHDQLYVQGDRRIKVPLYTVVGHRTREGE